MNTETKILRYAESLGITDDLDIVILNGQIVGYSTYKADKGLDAFYAMRDAYANLNATVNIEIWHVMYRHLNEQYEDIWKVE